MERDKVQGQMKILFLGPRNSPIIPFLQENGKDVFSTESPISPDFVREYQPNIVVSYGYRHIIKKDTLDVCLCPVINLHIALLPWNRGADPNFWSLVENTPRGVTIHYVDEGIDTGDIIAQKEVAFSSDDTLATSYQKLQDEIQELFRKYWNAIIDGTAPRMLQESDGSFHKVRDKEPHLHILTDGWDTPISVLENYEVA